MSRKLQRDCLKLQWIETVQLLKESIHSRTNQSTQEQINLHALKTNEKHYEAYLLEQEVLKIMGEEVIYAK